jgi:hypothetical protein
MLSLQLISVFYLTGFAAMCDDRHNMKELTLDEMERMSKRGQKFVAAESANGISVAERESDATGAGVASSADRSPLGFWVLGAALRALWLKV